MFYCFVYIWPTSFTKYTAAQVIWKELPNELRHCEEIGRFPIQTPLRAQPGLGTQPRYESPSSLRIEHRQIAVTNIRRVKLHLQ